VGYSLGIDPTAFRLGAAALILIIGIVLLVPALQNRFALAAAPVAMGGQALIERLRPSGIGGQFALGMLLGAIWSPCSGPTLYVVANHCVESSAPARACVRATNLQDAASLLPCTGTTVSGRQHCDEKLALSGSLAVVGGIRFIGPPWPEYRPRSIRSAPY
jgi:hypothetical protein